LDSKSGASLKLTILNKSGRIWTMVAGGGASVIYRLELLIFLFGYFINVGFFVLAIQFAIWAAPTNWLITANIPEHRRNRKRTITLERS
jgi:hypothetical protein